MAEHKHPITPPPELVRQWMSEYYGTVVAPGEATTDIANRAAQWGADQELEACREWVQTTLELPGCANQLRAARRPKPPSLKEQALEALDHIEFGYATGEFGDTIRRALEALPDD